MRQGAVPTSLLGQVVLGQILLGRVLLGQVLRREVLLGSVLVLLVSEEGKLTVVSIPQPLRTSSRTKVSIY